MPPETLFNPADLALMFIGLVLGAIVKGAIGAGLPIIAIPTIAAIYDVRIAVVLMVIPNFVSNAWQIYKYRDHNLDNHFARDFAIAGIVGAGMGTLLLAYLSLELLNIAIAIAVFSYVGLRVLRPEFKLAIDVMQRWAVVAGTSAGVLQGAIGLSAPITITFLSSGRLARSTFVLIASLFFAGMCLSQLPLQIALGLMNWNLVILGILALIPIMIGLPIGEALGKKLSTIVFDRVILILLCALAIKMLIDAWATIN